MMKNRAKLKVLCLALLLLSVTGCEKIVSPAIVTNTPTAQLGTPKAIDATPNSSAISTETSTPTSTSTSVVPYTCKSTSGIAKEECEALKTFYESTNGPNWKNNTGWLDAFTPPCNWYGVDCAGKGTVVALRLSNNGLIGSIPPEIRNLVSLRELALAQNQLNGAISPVSSLSQLETLLLYDNQFTDSISPLLGELKHLKTLVLSKNNLYGEIPGDLRNLSQLVDLKLDNNQLSGTIPEALWQLTNMRTLWLASNPKIGGTLSESIGALERLEELHLGHMNLEGPLPKNLSELHDSLTFLILSSNHFNGEIGPEYIDLLRRLETIDISHNHFTVSDQEVITILDEKNPGWNKTQTSLQSYLSTGAVN
jgi:Leucine-rich repeat (LRR) protein